MKKIILLFALTVYALNTMRAQVPVSNDTVPVIVHIIHANEPYGSGTNLDSVQVYSQFKVLNQDFNGAGYNVQNVPSVWQPLIAVTGMVFVPALWDPNGNLLPEPGIDRVPYNSIANLPAPGGSGYTSSTIDTKIKPATIWDPSLYCNVWVLKLGGGATAYSTFPDSSGLPWIPVNGSSTDTTDGIVAGYQFFGDTLNVMAPFHKGRSVTHEFGHFFGLIHFYTGCGSQYVPDLPIGDYGAMQTACVFPGNGVCSSYPDGPMFNNFMMYAADTCMNMFTDDQGDTMVYVLHHAQYKNQYANSWTYKLSGPAGLNANNIASLISFYPNPSQKVFKIKHSGVSIEKLKVTDINGRDVKEFFNAAADELEINAASGLYFVRIQTNKGEAVKRVIIE